MIVEVTAKKAEEAKLTDVASLADACKKREQKPEEALTEDQAQLDQLEELCSDEAAKLKAAKTHAEKREPEQPELELGKESTAKAVETHASAIGEVRAGEESTQQCKRTKDMQDVLDGAKVAEQELLDRPEEAEMKLAMAERKHTRAVEKVTW
eukprot:6491870-Amphidinium_carterae.4